MKRSWDKWSESIIYISKTTQPENKLQSEEYVKVFRAKTMEENSPLFPSKKLNTSVIKAKNAGIKNSNEIPVDQANKNLKHGEDVESSLLKPTTNISKERKTDLNSNRSEFQSSLQQQLPLDEERVSHRRKLTNIRLSQLIFPKCAWMVLNDLKKGCVYETEEKCMRPRLVLVTVKHKDGLMAVGEGSSKTEAKNIAAENAIKQIVLDLILQKESLYSKDVNFKDTEGSQNIIMSLPWKELTSLAVYKLFEEWQSQGVQFPELFLSKLKLKASSVYAKRVWFRLKLFKSKPNSLEKMPLAVKKGETSGEVSNEDVPSATNDRNPCAVLTTILPGIAAVEVERQDFPQFHVTMGYLVQGKLYSASGGTKKEAKKKAAMVVLKTVYGMEIPE